MPESTDLLGGLAGIGKSIGDVFINLSAEYPALLDAILLVFAFAGVIVSASACYEVAKLGKRDGNSNASPNSIFWKLVAGASLIDIAFWAHVWTDSLWSLADPLEISAYGVQGGDDYAKTAIMAAIGMMVITGYVTLGRAYLMTSKVGYLSPEARSDIIGSIISRVAAGSAMIASLHLADVLENSTGFNWLPV